MDTTAYLTRQGWLGAGHALHPNGHGIKKPLIVSKKPDKLGVGRKAYDAHADQWWSRAFDDTLKSINGQQPRKEGIEVDAAAVVPSGAYATKWSGSRGLYGGFVRGEGLRGTMGREQNSAEPRSGEGPSKKRRRLNGCSRNDDGDYGEQFSSDQVPNEHDCIRSESQQRSLVPSSGLLSQKESSTRSRLHKQLVSETTTSQQEMGNSSKSQARNRTLGLDGSPLYCPADHEEHKGKKDHGSVEAGSATLEATMHERETLPQGHEKKDRHAKKRKERGLKHEISETGKGSYDIKSMNRSEPGVKKKTKKRKSEKIEKA